MIACCCEHSIPVKGGDFLSSRPTVKYVRKTARRSFDAQGLGLHYIVTITVVVVAILALLPFLICCTSPSEL
jgi:hypothetical protein